MTDPDAGARSRLPAATGPGGASPLDAAGATLSQSLFRPVRDGNAFEVTVERLVQTIKLGVVPVGDRLPPERELADLLGVSRMTLREAIKALAEAGFVESRRGRGGGTFVTYQVAVQQREQATDVARAMGERLHQVLDFRRVVEPGAAALAASRTLSPAECAYLSGCVAECTGAADDAQHRIADSRLHLAIASVTGCAPLVTAVADVQSQFGELLAAIPVLRRNIAHADAQHAAIVRAILDGDGATARSVMEEHCDATAALLRGFLG
ncbi:MAG TPA: GntR family transcriptional regulator [Kribbellaceae bacterium]